MQEKYFILDSNERPKEVSETEHNAWAKANAEKYNESWQRKDGTKSISLTFQGIQKHGGELILFNVHALFSDTHGHVITEKDDMFDDYEEAKEHYEFKVYKSGG